MPKQIGESNMETGKERRSDSVNHPSHYNQLPIECIEVVRHFPYNLGNAIKYIWRAQYTGKEREDLEKAIRSLQDHLEHLED